MNRNLKWFVPLALLIGFLLGTIPPVSATPIEAFAGYYYPTTLTGVNANIAYKNPNVPASSSSEWAMADNNPNYIQSGWLKYSGWSSPHYFGEYHCATVCQFEYGAVPAGTTHLYEVSTTSQTGLLWCIYIDGVCKTSVSSSTVGFSTAPRAQYDGESHDTTTDIGGTATSHLRISTLQYRNTSFNWFGVNTSSLINYTTSGTRYRASNGFSGTTFVDNWSVP